MRLNQIPENIARGKVFRKSKTKQEAVLNLKKLEKKINSSNSLWHYPLSGYKNKNLFIKNLNLIKDNNILLKKNLDKTPLQIESKNLLPYKPKNYTLRYIPTSIKVFLNSIYSFNKSYVKNLPHADNLVYKIIKSYFSLKFLSDNKQGKTSKLLARRYKKLSLNKIIVSKPEIKHSADNVMITVYVYNKKKHSVIYRIKTLYNSFMNNNTENNNKNYEKRKNQKNLLKLNKKNPLKFLKGLAFLRKTKIKAEKKHKTLKLWLKKKLFLLDKSKTCPTSKVNISNIKANPKKTKVKQKFKSLNIKLNKAFSMQKKKNYTLSITSKLRYNLKMNFLLDQDRDYTSSLRGLNYANKKIFIVMKKKTLFYKKNKKILKYLTNLKKSEVNLINLQEKNSLKISKTKQKKLLKKQKNKLLRKLFLKDKTIGKPIQNKKQNKKNLAIFRQKYFIVKNYLSIKQKFKFLMLNLNIEKYRHKKLKIVNRKKRRILFRDIFKKNQQIFILKKKISKLNSKFLFSWLKKKNKNKRVKVKRIKINLFKRYDKVTKYKKLKKIIFKILPMQKQNIALLRKTKFKANLVIKKRKNTKKFLGNGLTPDKTLNYLKNLYKPINIFNEKYPKKDIFLRGQIRIERFIDIQRKKRALYKAMLLKLNNKYIWNIKSKYLHKSYKSPIIYNASLYWVNILKSLDIGYYIKTKKFNKSLNKFLMKQNFISLFVKRNLITQLVSSDYAYIKNFLKVILLQRLILQRDILYLYYIRSLHINNILFKTGFINSLLNILSNVYNKKVILNIVSLKYLYLNSDIFTQAITTRLKNHRKNRLNKVLKKVLALVYLAKTNELAYNIHSPIFKYINKFNNNFLHLRNTLAFTGNSYGSKLKPNTKKQNKLNLFNGLPLYNLNHSLYNQINFIKCKSVFGIKLEASGRLSKRNTASRKIFKVKYLGNLKFNNILNSYDSSYIIKNNIISNIQFTKIAGKTRIGSFGIKGWINNN